MSSNAVLTSIEQPIVIVHSEVLGDVTVSEDRVLDFSAGVLGLPDCRRYAMIPTEREGLFWLQSLDHSALIFLLLDPFPIFPGFSLEVPTPEAETLQGPHPSDILVLAIVTLPRTRDVRPTANLQGPLVINLTARTGRQLALEESDWGVRCPFDLD